MSQSIMTNDKMMKAGEMTMKTKFIIVSLFLIAAANMLSGQELKKTAERTGFSVVHPWWVVDRGGGKSSAGNFELRSSIGQPTIQKMIYIDTGSVLEGGFIPGLRTYSGSWSTYMYSFTEGWNLISLPLIMKDTRKSILFPRAISDAYLYSKSYIAADTLRNGVGYWLKFPSVTPEFVNGTINYSDTTTVSTGWNIIGVPSSIVPVSNIVPLGTTILSHFFGFGNIYYAEDTLQPGIGYWVKVSADGSLVLNAVPALMKRSYAKRGFQYPAVEEKMNQITLTDAAHHVGHLYFSAKATSLDQSKYELPPPPPTEVMDVRYFTNRYAEFADKDKTKETEIIISSAQYPLIIRWMIEDYSVGASLIINNREIKLARSSEFKLDRLDLPVRLKLFPLVASELPAEFSLQQNFPNPFNPVTTFKYGLPVNSKVRLTIYNTLGQIVTILADEVLPAGYKQVEWNADFVASGVYFYRLEATSISDPSRTFAQVKKLIYIK